MTDHESLKAESERDALVDTAQRQICSLALMVPNAHADEANFFAIRLSGTVNRIAALADDRVARLDANSAREVKNALCIDGHLNRALDAIMASTSPDEMFSLLTSLAHTAVDAAFDAQLRPATTTPPPK